MPLEFPGAGMSLLASGIRQRGLPQTNQVGSGTRLAPRRRGRGGLRCDESPPAGVIGQVPFVGRTAGVRYVLVRVGFVRDGDRLALQVGNQVLKELKHGSR